MHVHSFIRNEINNIFDIHQDFWHPTWLENLINLINADALESAYQSHLALTPFLTVPSPFFLDEIPCLSSFQYMFKSLTPLPCKGWMKLWRGVRLCCKIVKAIGGVRVKEIMLSWYDRSPYRGRNAFYRTSKFFSEKCIFGCFTYFWTTFAFKVHSYRNLEYSFYI